MATIRDVAAAAGVSATTVSIIINGRAEEKRIPKVTVDKVVQAMQKLGYQPNLSARRLRTNEAAKPVIAFYWPLDYRSNMLGVFLSAFQKSFKERNIECELVVVPYENDHIDKSTSAIIQNSYNGIIVGAATTVDMQYLESLDPPTPLVLINRESGKFATVGSNSEKIGRQAASLIRQKGYKEVAIIRAEHSYHATGERTSAFIRFCEQFRIRVHSDWIFTGSNTIAGGSVAAESFCALSERPKILYCESDCMAQGALYTLRKYGILCPQDVELLSVNTQSEENMQYLIPSISTISMPTEKIADSAVSVLFHAIQHGGSEPIHIELDPVIHLRESFRLYGSSTSKHA